MTTNLDQKQLAARWNMHPRTLENWRQQGRGPKFFKLHEGPKAPVRYRLEDIEEFEKKTIKIEVVQPKPIGDGYDSN